MASLNPFTLITSFIELFWWVIKTATIDFATLLLNFDKLLFNYTSTSGWLIFTFLIGRYTPDLSILFKKNVSKLRNRNQNGGAPGLVGAVSQATEAFKQAIPQAQQAISQVIPQAIPQPQYYGPQPQQYYEQPQPQQQYYEQPQPQQQYYEQPQQYYEQPQKPIQEGSKINYTMMAMTIMFVYYMEHADDCRKQAGGSLDIKSFLYNGFWTFGTTYFLMYILEKTPIFRMIETIAVGPIGDIIKGFVLYFIYNLVRNYRNITKKNVCKKTKKEDFINVNEQLEKIKKITKKIKNKLKSNNIKQEDFEEVLKTMNVVDNLKPTDLLKASNEIKKEIKKEIDSTKNIKKIKTQIEEEKEILPLNRRTPPHPVGIEKNSQTMLSPYQSIQTQVKNNKIGKGGRVIAIDL